MSSTQHQLIEQCATRLRGIVEVLDNIHHTSPQRWLTDLDDVHSSAESLLAMIKDQAPPSEDQLIAAGLSYPLAKEDAVQLWYAGFRSEVVTVLEAWEAIGHDIGMNPSKGELLDSLRNMAAICNAHGNDMPAQSAIDQRQVIADAITGALAFGAQASQPPAEDHWLRPFYDIGRAEGQRTQELAMLVRMLASSLKRHAPDSNLVARATNYLAAKGLAGTPLRDSSASVEQAGGDERDFQAKGAQEVPSPVSKEYDRHLIGLLRKGEALPGHQEEAADEIERLRDWNDHLNNTVLPNILNPNFLMLMKGGERLLDLCTKDGKFIGVSLNDMKDVFDWMVTHARIAPDHAALAQPSPAQAEAEQPEIVAFRYRCTNAEGEPLPGWFYSDGAGTLGLREPLMAVSQHERIIGAMRAVVTQLRQHKSDYMDAGQETYWALQNEIREREAEIARLDGLVSSRTVERDAAQAEVERLRQGMKGDYDIDAWLEWTKERDAALARVAELEAALSSALSQHGIKFMDPPDGGDTPLIEQVCRMSQALAELEKQESVAWVEVIDRDYGPYKFYGKRLLPKGKHQLYAAPVAQAQHSVPELLVRAEDFVSGKEVPQAWLDVQAERRRQITAEGWTPEHDDLYCAAELPRAAAAYILNGANDEAPAIWPFSAKWWKPSTARRDMVKACALGLAEIERLDRVAASQGGPSDA
ncbi:hypothetical protein [Pseudomonas aeruginosa]|uniref:hypothetical protein n=1 Tax=Pseudomonas aeruginosa TaxID=287 RepID=UPI00244C3BAB|nr:hypothetical protein [Pseudomonas aeruginosa]MDG9827448.1 hypothetical protein [Pseudomonas aeruginosa]MDH0409613.1 hypothetical protein [Pseudomonas aeruginosa]